MRVPTAVSAAGLLLVLAVATVDAAPAQSTLGPGFGLAYMELRDDVLVPLRFIGPHLTVLRPEYKLRLDQDWLAVEACLGLAPLFDRHGFLIEVFPFDAGAGYLRRLGADRSGGSFFLGARARWSMDMNSPEYWDDEHFYWLTAIDLGPALGYVRPLGSGRQLEVDLSVQPVALVSRPPRFRFTKTEPDDLGSLFGMTHEDLRFATMDEYQAARLSVAWRRPLGRGDFTIGYRGRFARASWPLPVIVLENSVNLTWGFGL